MSEQKIKAILFDLGNVLIKVNTESLEEQLSKFGKIQKGTFVKYFNDSYTLNKYQEGKLTSSQFYTKTYKKFKLKIRYREFYAIWNSIFDSYPEMDKIVEGLKSKYPEIKLILFSNTNEEHYEFIKRKFPVLELLDSRILSYEVGRQKPHSAIFKSALDFSKTLAKETFYTDDRLDLIKSARSRGFKAFQFTDAESLLNQLSKYNIVL